MGGDSHRSSGSEQRQQDKAGDAARIGELRSGATTLTPTEAGSKCLNPRGRPVDDSIEDQEQVGPESPTTSHSSAAPSSASDEQVSTDRNRLAAATTASEEEASTADHSQSRGLPLTGGKGAVAVAVDTEVGVQADGDISPELAELPPLQNDEASMDGGVNGGHHESTGEFAATASEGQARREVDESASATDEKEDSADHGEVSSSATRASMDASASTAPLHLLAAAAAAPLHTTASLKECGADGHCRACSSLLRQCCMSNQSLETRLEQILQVNSDRNRHRGFDQAEAGNRARHAHLPSHAAAGRLPRPEPNPDIASCVKPRHAKRFSSIREALSRKTPDENRRHRDELKRVLRAMDDDRRRRLSEETGVPLETVHLAQLKHNPSSTAKTSPDVHHDKAPPHAGFEGDGEARDSCLNGTARGELAHSRITQKWLDETQKVMGRYLAERAHAEQSSRGSESSSRNATVLEPVIPFALRQAEGGNVGQTASVENETTARAAEKPQASERPAAALPIKKRKEVKQSKDEGMKKKAKKATPERSPKPNSELERLERETRECHKKTLPPGNDGTKLRSFALGYNEWSVLAVAKWANRSAAGGDNGTPLELPTSPTHFRKCNVCGKFGHFDVLCPRLSPTTSKAFKAEMDELVARSDPATDVTEVCEGYAIEQSNVPFDDDDATQGPRKRRLPSQVCVMELDRLVIQAAPTADLLLEFA